MKMGPGLPCLECGEVYGGHRKGCGVPIEREKRQREVNRKLGTELLAAIERKDAEEIGRLLRQDV